MTSNVTAILVALIGCLTSLGLALIFKGTDLSVYALIMGFVMALCSLVVAEKIASNEESTSEEVR